LLIFLEGDQITASSWVLFAKRKLLDLKAGMARMGRQVAAKRFKIDNDTDISIKSVLGLDEIRIKVEIGLGGLFIADTGGQYEYHADLDHYRYGLKKFDNGLGLKTWYSRVGMSIGRGVAIPQGVSYYKGKVYTVDSIGWMDVWSESGEHLEEVELWSKVNPVGGSSQNYIHIRGDKIFVSANYNGNFYRVYEFDMAYNYVKEFPGPYGSASYGSMAIMSDPANNRLYIANSGFVGQTYGILVHEIDSGDYLGNEPTFGGEAYLCSGLFLYKGILHVADGINLRIIRYQVSDDTVKDVIDCTPFLPSWITLRALAVDDSGIYLTAYKNVPEPTELQVFVKKLSTDGLTEIKTGGVFMGNYNGGTVYGTEPPLAMRFWKPNWMDIKNSENK